jgi:hypothetical protein
VKRMKILLQQRDSGLYFETLASWTADAAEAMDFVSSTAALDYCAANKLAGVQIVLKFQEEKHEIVLPAIPLPVLQPQPPSRSA